MLRTLSTAVLTPLPLYRVALLSLSSIASFSPVLAPEGTDAEARGATPREATERDRQTQAGEGQAAEWDDCVQMMTMHSAKGLEFPLVFIVGMEEGLFPSQRSLEEEGKLEEERRLCYVGITRAREQLVLCCAEHRRLYGQDLYPSPSRFVSEIPENLIDEIRGRHASSHKVSSPQYKSSSYASTETVNGIYVGQLVNHKKFGEGMVTNLEGNGSHARVQVNFNREGSKWLVMAYANLSPV